MNAKFDDGAVGLTAVVSVQGGLDATNAALFEAHCKKRLASLVQKSLVIDLRAANFLSSAGLRSILILGKHVKAAGGRLAICGLQGVVRETFVISGFLDLFPVAETLEQAAGLAGGGPPPPGAATLPANR